MQHSPNESAKWSNNELGSGNGCSTHPQTWWGSGREAGQSGPQETHTGRTLSAFWRGPVTSGPRCPLRRSPGGTTRSPQTSTQAPGRPWGPAERDWLHWASQLLWGLQCLKKVLVGPSRKSLISVGSCIVTTWFTALLFKTTADPNNTNTSVN